MKDESLNLSFLAPIRASVGPTVFDLDAYFPGKLFWRWALVEPYTLDAQQMEELRVKGWEPLDQKAQATTILRLTSQLSLLLGIRVPGKTEPSFWAHTEDLRQVTEYPVVLVYESTRETPIEQLQQMVPGTQALIFEGDAIYRYTLEQLGEVGVLFWQQVVGGTQPTAFHFSTTTAQGQFINPLHNQEAYTSFLEGYNARFRLAQQAAQHLATCYWQHHERHPNKAGHLLQAITDIPQAFRRRVFVKDGSLIPATAALEAALLAISNASEGARGWTEQEQKPTYVHQKANSTTAVTMARPTSALPDSPEDITKQLWQQVNSLSDLDGDVLLAMLAQVVAVGTDEQGGTWITAQDILNHRGIVPKKHTTREPGKKREAGHRPEDMRGIATCVERLRDTHVTVRSWREPRKKGGRRRIVKQESYLVLISDFLLQTREGEAVEEDLIQIAWYYRPGTCLDVLPPGRYAKAAWLLQQALRYDPIRHKWEKRLARYFMFHLRINNAFGGATITRTIGTILQELSLSINKTDPEKTKTRFERAMHTLEQDGHISDWGEQRYLEAMKQRPTRGWLSHWLSYELEITAAPILEELAEDMIDQLKQQRRLST